MSGHPWQANFLRLVNFRKDDIIGSQTLSITLGFLFGYVHMWQIERKTRTQVFV